MRRTLLTLALLLLAAAPASAATRTARVQLVRCHHAVAPAHRSFHLLGAMRRVPGTHLMAIRVQLQVRLPFQRRWRPYTDYIAADPLFGKWIPEDRNADRYVFSRTVDNLAGPENAAGRHRPLFFRVRAAFRWYGADHKPLLTRRATTAPCFQPELRPDLAVKLVPTATPGHFTAIVRNVGLSDAGPFAVIVPDQPRPLALPGLPARGRAWHNDISCGAASQITVTVDPATAETGSLGAVDEANERNNVATATCP